jgi:hypothetical protein
MKLGIVFAFAITLTLTAIILSILILPNIGLADTAPVEIYVNISSTSALSVQPSYLEFIQVPPGGNSTDKTLTVTNTGSTDFSTGVYASVDSFNESTNPLHTNNIGNFEAGDFLVLKNATDSTFYFVNRIEWNDSDVYSQATGKSTNGTSYGFFHNASKNYLWEIAHDRQGECLNTTAGDGMVFKIKTTNFNNDYNIGTGTTSATGYANTTEWSSWNFTAGPLQNYCVAIAKNCQRFMLYRWDKNSTLPDCINTVYLNKSLGPGGQLVLTANAWIPQGTPAGNASSSTLTITAT